LVQPLKGLNLTNEILKEEFNGELVKALKENAPVLTNEFIEKIIEKGAIKENENENENIK
jgi:hypothetical protein